MDSHFIQPNHVMGLGVVDPFAHRTNTLSMMLNALLATALFRCWHILLFYAGWATAISVISHNVYDLSIPATLLTVLGTVLGFVISYRTTSSFERYNEGRRLWSQIILGCRNFARTVWFHVPEVIEGEWTQEDKKARVMVEKATVINLLLAFATSVKHYLRGEDGIFFEDLYHLVKFLPTYSMPAGKPSSSQVAIHEHNDATLKGRSSEVTNDYASKSGAETTLQSTPVSKRNRASSDAKHLPMPITTTSRRIPAPQLSPLPSSPWSNRSFGAQMSAAGNDDGLLLPASNPPKWGVFDVWPLSLLINARTKRGKEVKGKKAARLRAKLQKNHSHNIPLEISLYLSSYIAQLQQRKAIDAPTATNLMNTLTQLVDALTGLERILTTPIPFSYSVHLWVVTSIYCLALPFQTWGTLKWLTIPGTVIVSFVFFGFLVAGEEIENPFGYDKNDLNMDHFTNNIIRNELKAIMSSPPPDIALWAFSPANDAVLSMQCSMDNPGERRACPDEWVRRGPAAMMSTLATSEAVAGGAQSK